MNRKVYLSILMASDAIWLIGLFITLINVLLRRSYFPMESVFLIIPLMASLVAWGLNNYKELLQLYGKEIHVVQTANQQVKQDVQQETAKVEQKMSKATDEKVATSEATSSDADKVEAASAAPTATASTTQNPQATQVQYVMPQRNGIGLAGFIIALVSFFTGEIPVIGWIIWLLGAIFSIIGLFKKPKGFAIAGTILSFFALIVIIMIVGAIGGMMSLGGM